MDRATMRKRGWSIQSDHSGQQGDAANQANDDDDDDDHHMDDSEKKELLQSFPVDAVNSKEEEEEHAGNNNNNNAPPAAKRRKTDDTLESGQQDGSLATNNNSTNNDKEQRVEVAKKKLSKWAARLFDPDRPRGLVEAPRTIPLNDEFLTAFGKREKEFDDQLGRDIDIQQEIEDEEEDGKMEASSTSTRKLPVDGRKVKIVNLAFTTTVATLEEACEKYGPVENANLLMDKERPSLNTGRAYVTFESTESADACVDGLQSLDNRPLRVAMAPSEATKRGARRSMGSNTRYWVKDISTKCFRCGQVGHMVDSCPNAAILKPCPLCGGFDHDMRTCPNSRVCFRCGGIGHINRDCSYRQNLPKRVVCGICFQSGHHRCQCRRRATDAPSHDAQCFVCNKRGHFMCSQMKWFFGLDSVSCFNCGRQGHHGYNCDRPGVDVCARDDALADLEIEKAYAFSLANEVEQQSRNRGRDRGHGGGGNRSRAKSQPPPRGGSGGQSRRDGGRGYPQQQQNNQQQRRQNKGNRGYQTQGGRGRR